jgi:vitamin B12 transporter
LRKGQRRPALGRGHAFRYVRLFVALGLWFTFIGQADGQSEISEEPETIELEPTVITGTTMPTSMTHLPASVTVITKEQMELMQKINITEILRQVPGLHIDQAGARGGVSSVYLRGGDPNYTVVLIDGVKINDPTNNRGGSFDFSTLNVDNIERIEIVRGPLSSIYGSDAMSGVIHMITLRDAGKVVRSLEIYGGRHGDYRALLQTRGRLDRVNYSLSGSYLDNGEPVEGSEFINKTYNANLSVDLPHQAQLRSMVRYADSHLESYPDDSGGPVFAVLRKAEERDAKEFVLGSEISRYLLSPWHATIHAGFYDRQEDTDSPGIAPGARDPLGIPPNTSETQYRRYTVGLRNLFLVNQGMRLSIGVDVQSEEGSSRGRLSLDGGEVPTRFDLKRNLWASFVEVQYPLPAGPLLQLGARLDRPEGFDGELSPRVGLSYKHPAFHTTLHASWGEGFKLPSFFSLSHSIVGNPDLDTEKSRGLEVGAIQPVWGGRLSVSATYFYKLFKDTIDFQEGPPPVLVNRSEITTEGIEMTLNAKVAENLDLVSHGTYVKAEIQGTDEELRNRPEWRGGIAVQWRPLSGLVLNLDALYVGRVLDSSIPTDDRELDAYIRVDIAITWNAGLTWQYFLTVDNLFNADYEEAVGFPAPGISPHIGLKARF